MKLGIIGSGGHSNAVADIAFSLGYNDLYFFDDFYKKKNNKVKGKLIGSLSKVKHYNKLKFIIAIGDNNNRFKVFQLLQDSIQFIKLVHPSSYVSPQARVNEGVVVMPNSTINSNAIIKKFSIINSNSVIEHDSIIGKFSHVCPGVCIAGNVRVGDNVFIGIGSSVINDIKIGKNVLIGAGTNIIKNISPNIKLYNKLNYEITKK